jgi:hypothetical protein
MWYYYIVVFIESAAFTRRLRVLVGNEETTVLRGIQNELIGSPARGDMVPGLAASAKGGLETQVAGKENAEVIATSTCILSIGNISEAQNEQKNKSI